MPPLPSLPSSSLLPCPSLPLPVTQYHPWLTNWPLSVSCSHPISFPFDNFSQVNPGEGWLPPHPDCSSPTSLPTGLCLLQHVTSLWTSPRWLLSSFVTWKTSQVLLYLLTREVPAFLSCVHPKLLVLLCWVPPQAWGDSLSVFGGHGLSCWSYCNSVTVGGLKHGTILFSSAGGQERGPCPSFSSLPVSLHIPACMTTCLRLKFLLFNLFLFSDFSIFLKQSLTV